MKNELDQETKARIRALRKFLKLSKKEEIIQGSQENEFEEGGRSYLVLLDDEADQVAQERIKESLWAFNASFLASYTKLPQKIFEALQKDGEGSNDTILQLIETQSNLEDFANDAVSADGRGHFIASYDFDENEEGIFYIYRTN